MKTLRNTVFRALSGAALVAVSLGSYATTVTPTTSGQTLANTLVGSGVTIVPGSVSFIGASGAAGTFTGGNSMPLGFNSGIILTSGDASIANGSVNTVEYAGADNSGGGDSSLSGLIGGAETYDAASLTFRFTVPASANNLYFNYVFASEEYNEWVYKGFNDVFGFFLDGQNIALLPGTSTPVSVDNVNNSAFSSQYRDNSPGPFATEYDGLTRVLQAQKLALDPNVEHTIKLAIADTGDHIYDSAVFLQAGTFDNSTHEHEQEDVPDAGSGLLLVAFGCAAVLAIRKRL